MKWAGGAGRQDGVHMVHTFGEVRTRTPAATNEAALEAIMPQAAWEALLRDAVQGLRPPLHPPSPLPMGLGHRRPLPTPPTRHDHTRKGKDKGKGRARDTKGHSGKRAWRGPK